MKIHGKDKNGNIRKIETRSKEEWWEFKPLDQYYIDGEKTTKEEAEKLFKEIKKYDPKKRVMFTEKGIAKIFKLGKTGRQLFHELLAERRELKKLREIEEKEFINLIKSWIRRWKRRKLTP